MFYIRIGDDLTKWYTSLEPKSSRIGMRWMNTPEVKNLKKSGRMLKKSNSVLAV